MGGDQYRVQRPPVRPRPPRVESSDEFLVRHGLLDAPGPPPAAGSGRPAPPGRPLPPPVGGASPRWPAVLGRPTTQRDERPPTGTDARQRGPTPDRRRTYPGPQAYAPPNGAGSHSRELPAAGRPPSRAVDGRRTNGSGDSGRFATRGRRGYGDEPGRAGPPGGPRGAGNGGRPGTDPRNGVPPPLSTGRRRAPDPPPSPGWKQSIPRWAPPTGVPHNAPPPANAAQNGRRPRTEAPMPDRPPAGRADVHRLDPGNAGPGRAGPGLDRHAPAQFDVARPPTPHAPAGFDVTRPPAPHVADVPRAPGRERPLTEYERDPVRKADDLPPEASRPGRRRAADDDEIPVEESARGRSGRPATDAALPADPPVELPDGAEPDSDDDEQPATGRRRGRKRATDPGARAVGTSGTGRSVARARAEARTAKVRARADEPAPAGDTPAGRPRR